MKKPSATLIGVFVLGAMALTVAAILFFGSGVLFKQRVSAVSYFSGSVAGLQTGALVTYRGVRIGEVKSIGILVDPDTTRSMVRVNMELFPQAVRMYGAKALPGDNPIPALVERGFSARLMMQSFVTGVLQVELDFRPDVQASSRGEPSDVPEIPTVPSPFQALTEQLQTLDISSTLAAFQRTLASLDMLLTSTTVSQTLEALPPLLADVRQTVRTIDGEVKRFAATGQHVTTETAASLQKTLVSVQKLADDLDREAVTTLAEARGTLRNANTAIDGANVLLDPNGRTVTDMQDAVQDFAETAARLREIAERVDRDPSVLIRGRRR